MESFTRDVQPQRVVFGVGAFACLPDEVARLGVRRILLIAGRSAKPLGDAAAERLGDRIVARCEEVRQHVPELLAGAAGAAARTHRADAIVTIGGGSATGLGKAVALTTGLPIIAVPTTYAGSELTEIYGITGEQKRTGRDSRVLPKVVLYDPALTVGLSPHATGSSGFNALAHCVEALYSPRVDPVVTLHAEEGIRVLADALPAAVGDPSDLAARSRALYGAYLAGTALAGGVTALHHKLCHVLGGSFGLVHGEVNAVLLPYVVAYNQPAAAAAMDCVSRALGQPDAAQGLRALAVALALPTSLAEIGMPADGLDNAAEQALAAVGANNPRAVDVQSIRLLLGDAYAGRQPHHHDQPTHPEGERHEYLEPYELRGQGNHPPGGAAGG